MDINSQIQNLDLTKYQCFYCDVRFEAETSTLVGYRQGEFDNFGKSPKFGIFVRVYNNGMWFFKSITNPELLDQVILELIGQSKKFTGANNDYFASVPMGHDDILRFEANHPDKISLSEKKRLCETYVPVLAKHADIKDSNIWYKDSYRIQGFKSNRGRSFIYDYSAYGLAIRYTLRDGDKLFKDGFRHWGSDFESLKGHETEVEDIIVESRNHLDAKPVPPGKYTVVMDSDVVGAFTHESFGHKSEADAMLGDEKAVKEWEIGMKVASDSVSIVDSGLEPNNSGYCPIDDEGVPAGKTYLVKDGKLAGRLHSLETAHEFKEKPTGNARAINFEFEPIVRMTNTYIEPGDKSLDELLKDIKLGIFVKDYRHGSGLSTFTIAPVRSYWVRDGKLAEPVRVSVISGTVFETLNNIVGLSKDFTIVSSVFGGCGKDEQMPLRVGDGGPTMVVEKMQVG